MRMTDNRYAQERRSLELALRMIRFEARTCTIRIYTGLSEDRIRNLYKSYVEGRPATAGVKRRRGKSPRRIDSLLRNSHLQFQASLLAGLYANLGLLEPLLPKQSRLDLTLGEHLCDAYEIYLQLLADRPLSFEHAWYLWLELQAGNELQFRACATCEGIILHDKFSIATRPCPWCKTKAAPETRVFR